MVRVYKKVFTRTGTIENIIGIGTYAPGLSGTHFLTAPSRSRHFPTSFSRAPATYQLRQVPSKAYD